MGNNVREYLAERERQLEAEVSRLKATLGPIEAELADVKKARDALGLPPSSQAAIVTEAFVKVALAAAGLPQRPSMKEMTVAALRRHFSLGATAKELIRYFASAWGQTVERSSLSPQLSRLKAEGVVQLVGKHWILSPDQRREIESGDGGPVPGQTLEPRLRGSTPPVSTSDFTAEEPGSAENLFGEFQPQLPSRETG